MSQHLQDAVSAISAQILTLSVRLGLEQHHPQAGADESDATIDSLAKQIARLRRVRGELEDIHGDVV